jgi:catechol 2,3-dioxygenase-like lactoylglutathione lyase family enzyme
MSDGLDNFHHLGVISRNLDAAVRQYERLGFAFTPVSLPRIPLTPGGASEALGVANRCAIFRDNYLEMLGVVDAARWAAITAEQRGPYDIDRPLRRYEGLHVLHFATDDIAAVYARLTAKNLLPTEIRPFQRPVDTIDGPQTMRARAFSFPPADNPEALLQIAQHDTPELVLQPRFMQHPNGAIALSEAIVCIAEPDGVAAKYAAYSAHSVRCSGHLRIVDLGATRLVVTDPDHLGEVLPGQAAPILPFLAGFTVAADLAAATSVLRRNGIGFKIHGDRIIVDARDACGSAALFERPNAGR